MPRCTTCGGVVTLDFARVFGSNDGEVLACPACATTSEDTGAAGRPG